MSVSEGVIKLYHWSAESNATVCWLNHWPAGRVLEFPHWPFLFEKLIGAKSYYTIIRGVTGIVENIGTFVIRCTDLSQPFSDFST